jgi:trans-aconitate methyltransferase
MLSRWAYYRHPQYLWTAPLRQILETVLPDSDGTVIDAPCGDGIITYWLSRHSRGASFELYDRSAGSLSHVRRYQPHLSHVVQADMDDLPTREADSIWLLINSLYLLPDAGRIVERLRPRMKHVLAVFPYTDHANYRAYFRRHPGESNVSAMSRPETLAFMAAHGYEMIEASDATYLPFHRLEMGPVNVLTARLFNTVDGRLVRRLPPCYWIARFSRRIRS